MGEIAKAAGRVFVGRTKEMEQLQAGLIAALHHRGGLFLLAGEPGIGKTRLAEQLGNEAHQRGVAVYWGLSTQAEGAPAYWPWVQILRVILRDLGSEGFARLAGQGIAQIVRMVPDMGEQFPDVAPASMDDDAARFAMYEAVAQFLFNASSRRPTLLVLEDLHWADEPSLILLQHVAAGLPHSATLAVGTYRDRELGAEHPLRVQFADYVRRGETTNVSVQGLADAEVASLLRALTDVEPAADLLQRLQAQTAGNPFFLKELARTLSTDGDHLVAAARVPLGVAAVLRRRIHGLSPDCRRMLEVAAVTGQTLDVEVIEAAEGIARRRQLDLIDEAVSRGVIVARGGGYAFTHGLFRDTVYDELSTARRADLHRAVAVALERLDAGADFENVNRLAYHFLRASSTDQSLKAKARRYAVAAAGQAMTELAYEEAVRLLEGAVSLGVSADPGERADLLISLGQARFMAGDVMTAIKAAQDASRIAEQLGDGDMLARAALVVRGVAGPGASNPIKELCEIALRNPPENPALRVQLLSQIVVASMWLPTADGIARAQELSGEAMRLADKAVDPDVVFAAIHARQMAMSGPDGVDERLHLAQRALELSTRSGRKWFEQWGHSWKADALSQLGRMSEAEGELSQLRRLADELREPRLLWRTLLAESSLALLRGRFADARRLSDDALAVGVKSQRPMAEFSHAMHHAVLTAFIGPDRAAWPAPAEDSPVSDPALRFNRAFALAQTGRNEEARLALREFVDALHAGLRWFAVLPVMSQLAQAVAAVDDAELAAILYADLTPYAAYNVAIGAGFGGFWGSVARFLGMLATTLERWDEAAEHFERAISFETEMGAPPFVACSQILYAEMLVRRGGPEDVRRARGLASAALTAGTAMGMKPWIERARALVSRLEARRIVSHPLSRRELEIARLVAEGLTNRTIAEKLHISERTAESHVKNICDKLGFNSRAQVAAWVSAQRPAG